MDKKQRRRVRILGLLLAVAMASLAAPTAATADSASIAFLDAAGNADPVAGVGRSWVVTGSADSQKYVYVKARPAGGASCAPSAFSDSGDFQAGYVGGRFNGERVNGAFRLTYTGTWQQAGTYQFCIWVATSSSANVTPFTQIVTFRNPFGSIGGVVSPVAPIARRRGTLLIAGTSEAPSRAYAKVRPAGGAACAPAYGADSGESLINGTSVNGAFRMNANVTRRKAGAYLACLWLTRDASGGAVLAGPQPVVFSVLAPCSVPKITKRMKLAGAKSALRRSHCRAGAVKYHYSKKRKRGRVVRFGMKRGTRMNPGTKVSIVVSKGRRPRR